MPFELRCIFTIPNSSCGKVMFSQVSVKNSGCVPACTGQGVVADPGHQPPREDTPWADTPRQTHTSPPTATAADGLHPTGNGMHSCLTLNWGENYNNWTTHCIVRSSVCCNVFHFSSFPKLQDLLTGCVFCKRVRKTSRIQKEIAHSSRKLDIISDGLYQAQIVMVGHFMRHMTRRTWIVRYMNGCTRKAKEWLKKRGQHLWEEVDNYGGSDYVWMTRRDCLHTKIYSWWMLLVQRSRRQWNNWKTHYSTDTYVFIDRTYWRWIGHGDSNRIRWLRPV